MSLNSVPSAERIHIGFFGRTNAGKSSVVNAFTNQDLSIVSDLSGTTTDPVKKSMELLPLGPVVIIDTPGLDDTGILGQARIKKAMEALQTVDICVIVADASRGLADSDRELLNAVRNKGLPYVLAWNKADISLLDEKKLSEDEILISAFDRNSIEDLKNRVGELMGRVKKEKVLVKDLLKQGDTAVLVIPVDGSAPKGRIILPQQFVMRELLEAHCPFVSCQPEDLETVLRQLPQKPEMVITDSSVFAKVMNIVPDEVKLTSFSILMARYKGSLYRLMDGAAELSRLEDEDTVLIAEGCTHHRQCNDIGAVQIPALIRKVSGKDPKIELISGGTFTDTPEKYRLIIHCGGCMLNDRQMEERMRTAANAGVKIVNYGIFFAYVNGILDRAVSVF